MALQTLPRKQDLRSEEVSDFTIFAYLFLCRCISSWFDDEGNLVMNKYWQDVLELYNDIRSKKD